MEDLLTFTGIIIIVFGILQIILFFKMWIMTNDVWKIKKHLIGCENDMYEYIIMGDNDKILRVLKKSFSDDIANMLSKEWEFNTDERLKIVFNEKLDEIIKKYNNKAISLGLLDIDFNNYKDNLLDRIVKGIYN